VQREGGQLFRFSELGQKWPDSYTKDSERNDYTRIRGSAVVVIVGVCAVGRARADCDWRMRVVGAVMTQPANPLPTAPCPHTYLDAVGGCLDCGEFIEAPQDSGLLCVYCCTDPATETCNPYCSLSCAIAAQVEDV
jgi:hypothetical protein